MENPDLFWGLRGGGGNFGVVTEFEFCLNPVGPTVVAGPILWAMEDSSQIMRFYRDWITEVPDELTTIVTFRRVAPSPIVPAELHGKHVVIVGCCYVGPAEEAEEVLRRLRSFRPRCSTCASRSRTSRIRRASTPHSRTTGGTIRSCNLAELNDEVIDTMANHGPRIASQQTVFSIFHLEAPSPGSARTRRHSLVAARVTR